MSSKTELSSPAISREAVAAAPLSRRTLFAGAGAAGALAAAAAVLPLSQQATPVVAALAPDAATGGYQLTEHVLRYYQTARV
ncbi:MAG: formate dehydrogenase [Rubrivivax sp.]|nr:formate dehydrogenase [Rubrivivax sp.]MDP3221766.1 formate dehydrogenase [Rubrivivax sp.]MDP3614951.1 formate dehydrogenase [Rubrivivax sp.]